MSQINNIAMQLPSVFFEPGKWATETVERIHRPAFTFEMNAQSGVTKKGNCFSQLPLSGHKQIRLPSVGDSAHKALHEHNVVRTNGSP